MPVHIGLRDFPGWVTFSTKTRTVLGNPEELATQLHKDRKHVIVILHSHLLIDNVC